MKWLLALCFALIPMSVRATTIEHFSLEEQAVLEERGALLDDFVDQLAANELALEARDVITSLSVLEREYILESLESLLSEEDIARVVGMILFPDADQPGVDGTRVTYYYRYLVWDTNDREYDYVYVFRLGTSKYPGYYRHWYRPQWTCWPTSPWIYGSQWRNPYFKDGSWYFEFLFSKTRVDIMTCYGYLELEYW